MYDQANRDIHCLRLSLTESCNLRCCYCRPQVPAALPPQELTDAELLHLVQLFAACGIDTLRLTGGEPLLRAGVPQLTARLKAVPGIRKVTLTTNGTLLSAQLPALKEAGLDGINLSLNSLSYTRNKRISRLTPQQHAAVKQAFEDAMFCGIPLKLNYMALRGYNEQDYRWLVRRYVRFFPVRLRFLELMPVGCARELQELGIPNSEILQQLRQDYPRLYSLPPAQSAAFGDGPAVYYTNPGWAGSVGFISPVHGKEPFCTRCNRVRLSASGFLRPCLASEEGVELGEMLRGGASDVQLLEAIRAAVRSKPLQHPFHPWDCLDIPVTRDMYRIGGCRHCRSICFGRTDGHLAAAQRFGAAALPLHHQPPGAVDRKRLCGVGLGAGAYGHPVAGHKAAGAVLVQTFKTRAQR